MTTAKILAFAGSTRRESWNRKVLEVAVAGARDAGAEVNLVNLNDFPMPIYNADWHTDNGVPETMRALRKLMMEANGIMIASPEYNTSITPLLKNTIDWLSQEVDGQPENIAFAGKVGALMGASNGAFGTIRALPHVSYILSNLGVFMLPVVAVPKVSANFDAEGKIANERAKGMLTGLGARLTHTLVKLS